MVEVTKLGPVESCAFIEKLIKHNEHDNLKLLRCRRFCIVSYWSFGNKRRSVLKLDELRGKWSGRNLLKFIPFLIFFFIFYFFIISNSLRIHVSFVC